MNLLVICHGNRYRSPFAEGMLKKLKPKISVKSAGVKFPIGNYPAAKPTREAAAARGFNLSLHRAKGVDMYLVDWADLILYMDNGNLKRLLEKFPVRDKCTCLASYVGGTRVPDPAFLTGEPREAVWKLLEKASKELIKTL